MTNILLNAANDYLDAGLSVIALTGKAPNISVHRRGLYDAFDGAGRSGLDEAFGHPDTTGIGIICRYPLIVVDIDGEDGAAQWLDIAKDDWASDRWVAKTGRGLHLYFASTTPTRTTKLGEKLDLKGEGGYVAAPPSLHPDGHRYEWLAAPSGPLPEAPDRLQAALAVRKQWVDDAKGAKIALPPRRKQFDEGKWWALPGFDGLIKRVANAVEGERNEVLNWAAYTMGYDGAGDEELEVLMDAAVEAGLDRREARTTVLSGIRSGRRARS